jgi:hypothetical protein
MGVGESGENAAAAQIDALRPGELALVRPDSARDLVARDRERTRRREGGVHRPDDAVLEDHQATISPQM